MLSIYFIQYINNVFNDLLSMFKDITWPTILLKVFMDLVAHAFIYPCMEVSCGVCLFKLTAERSILAYFANLALVPVTE